jgi:hypothetical protein
MEKKTKNRLLMPNTAKMIDWIRSEIPDVKVLYAEEGQYKVGSREGTYINFVSNCEEENDRKNRKLRSRNHR